jgi:hypothetical protein
VPPAAKPRRQFKRSDALLIAIAAAAVALMLIVPLAADWIWPSDVSTRLPRTTTK